MSSRSQQRRARLRAEYGFDFPDDFHRFWEFANRLSPLEPLKAFNDLGIALVGPFEVLAGRFDGRVPKHSLLLHWRYHDDPPEFFTVLAGDTDRLHWGYWLDDPDRGTDGCVASYFADDGLILSVDGDSLFEAVRLHLEHRHADYETYRDESPDEAEEYDQELRVLARFRERLMPLTAGRTEVGEEYTSNHGDHSERDDRIVADTRDGVGIVAPPEAYRPLSLSDRKLWAKLRKAKDPGDVVDEARRALSEGYPATALKLGQDLWGLPGKRRAAYAVELLGAAYKALGRESLRRVLQTHAANRALESVDILDDEG